MVTRTSVGEQQRPHDPPQAGTAGRWANGSNPPTSRLIKARLPADPERVIADSAAQPKAIVHPVARRLTEIARHKGVSATKRAGISLKQAYAQEGKTLRRQASGRSQAFTSMRPAASGLNFAGPATSGFPSRCCWTEALAFLWDRSRPARAPLSC